MLLLAAGYGKRLRPLTDSVPKSLVEVHGKTLIGRNLELLASQGASRVIINVFYLGEQIREAIGDGSRFGLQVEYSTESVLLDTGGAIKNIEPLLQHDTLLTFNSDILISPAVRLRELVVAQRTHAAAPAATLLLRRDAEAEAFGALGTDARGRIVRFLDAVLPGSAPGVETLMYTGISAIDRKLLSEMPERGQIFSLTRDVFRKVILQGGHLQSLRHDAYWNDVGTPERLIRASKDLETGLVH